MLGFDPHLCSHLWKGICGRKRIEGKSDEEAERITAYKVFAYEGMIARAQAEIEWAEKGLELVERLEPR